MSWNLTRSGLLQNSVFDNIKLRAAYGQANNVPAYGSKFTSLVVSNIAGNPGVLVITQEGEPGIKPERQAEFESGLDFSLFKGRLDLNLLITTKQLTTF